MQVSFGDTVHDAAARIAVDIGAACRVPEPASAPPEPPQMNSPSDEGRDIMTHLRRGPHDTSGAVAAGAPHTAADRSDCNR